MPPKKRLRRKQVEAKSHKRIGMSTSQCEMCNTALSWNSTCYNCSQNDQKYTFTKSELKTENVGLFFAVDKEICDGNTIDSSDVGKVDNILMIEPPLDYQNNSIIIDGHTNRETWARYSKPKRFNYNLYFKEGVKNHTSGFLPDCEVKPKKLRNYEWNSETNNDYEPRMGPSSNNYCLSSMNFGFGCNICNQYFNSDYDLFNHMEYHHVTQRCVWCGGMFSSKHWLLQHLAIIHNIGNIHLREHNNIYIDTRGYWRRNKASNAFQKTFPDIKVEPTSAKVKVKPASSNVKVKPASSNIKVKPASNVKVEPTSNVKVEPSSNIKVEPSSNIKVEPSSNIKVVPASSNVKVEPIFIKVEPIDP